MYRREKKMPTIIAVIIISLAIGGMVYLDRSLHIFTSSAKNLPIPEDVHFTNITDNSFVVSWLSSTPTNGAVTITSNSQSLTSIDDLDSDYIQRPRYTHYITVKNLKENTDYSVKIHNGDNKCSNQSSCPTYIQKTGIKLSSTLSIPPARGSIINNNQQIADGAIVYLTAGKSAPLSGRVDSSGLWVIPLNNLRSQDLLNRLELADNDIVQITATTQPNQISSAVIDIKSIRQNLSLPTMQIGNSYNFINLISKRDQLANSSDQKVLGFQTQILNQENINPSQTTYKTFDILFPSEDNNTTTDQRPRFRGIGLKDSQLLITVNSTPQTDRLVISQDGTWSWRPSQSLPPGTHNITIQGYDENGTLVTIARKFIVLKSGEQILGEATVSATLTPTKKPSPTITPTYTPTPTYSPSPTINISITRTITPTNYISPTIVYPSSTPTVKPPVTGIFRPTLILIATGIILFIAGAKFFITL